MIILKFKSKELIILYIKNYIKITEVKILPIGILVIRWDNEIGPINEGFFPDNLKITNNLLTQVYSSHRYQSLKPGFASISLKNNKVVSFFSGVGEDYISVENYVIALLLRRDEIECN